MPQITIEERLAELERRVLELERGAATTKVRVDTIASSLDLSTQAVNSLSADLRSFMQTVETASAKTEAFIRQSAATKTAFEEQGEKVDRLRNSMEALMTAFRQAMARVKQSGRK